MDQEDIVDRALEKVHLKSLEVCRKRFNEEKIAPEMGEPIIFALTDAIDRVSSQISREGICRLDYLKALETALWTFHAEIAEQAKIVSKDHPTDHHHPNRNN